MNARSDNVRGGLVMLVAVGSFSLMDACLKVLSGSYPPFQVAALRALASLPVVLLWIGLTGGFRQLTRVRLPLHLLRGALGVLMLAGFAFAIRTLPLAEAYTIFFIAPLLITLFAALFLGERIEWQRWAAIAAGLCGVLIVLRPTGQNLVTTAGLAVLLSAVAYALSAISVRVLGRSDSTQSMVFWLMFTVAIGASVMAWPNWQPIQQKHALVLVGTAVFGTLGQWAITEAFKIGESSFIAPFEYTALAWGTALDWIFWRAIPVPRTFVGAAVIIASGIYLIHREQRTTPPGQHQDTAALPGDAD